jgi:3-hydroxyisobutyrate dehydrogenase-like beta-hydroxyacid dehydrogenase
MEKIGIIGMGNMGLSMSKALLRGGCQVVGYDIRHEALDRLLELGGVGATSPQEVAESVAVVLLSLPNSPITERVVLGERGLLAGVGKASLIMDMGSSVPSSTRMLGSRLAEKGVGMIDAPVSGGPKGAEAGTLAIIVGGAAQDVERAMPILRLLGSPEKISRVGPLGSGHSLKAVNNYLYACAVVASSEALVVAVKAGLDARTVQKVLSTSSGYNRAVHDNIPNQVLDRSFPPTFALGLLSKDVNTFLTIAEESGVRIPLAVQLKEMIDLGVAELGAEVGDSRIITLLEKWAGVEVRG